MIVNRLQTNYKCQISNIKKSVLNLEFKKNLALFVICNLFIGYFGIFGLGIQPSFAKEINILYTGETHGMLYTCSCPVETDGGVARRATLIKELRNKNPNTLLLDSGGFFAGGLLDEFTQNTDLDAVRTVINVKAMDVMGYDAVNVGDDEFNFGKQFLESGISNAKINFISSNIKAQGVKPFLIKEIDGINFGIIGLTGAFTASKAKGSQLTDPKVALKSTIEYLKNNGVDIIVVLSHLGENESLNLAKEVSDIDILITGHSVTKEKFEPKIGSTIIVRPAWQGRRLGKLSLQIKDKKISSFKAEEIRLSDKVKDAQEILAFLPKCFSDANCKMKGRVGICQNPGEKNANCLFEAPKKISLTVIQPKPCKVCNTTAVVNLLKERFPGLNVSYKYYPDKETMEIVDKLGIKNLPVYLFGREIENEKKFSELQSSLEKKDEFYILKTEVTGLSYFLDREKKPGRLDIFLSLFDPDSKVLLDLIKEYNPNIHFLAVFDDKGFDAAKGLVEVEEYKRSLCVQKYYPNEFWHYISCRAGNIGSSWWQDCVGGVDENKISVCARSKEGEDLLKENIRLNKELKVLLGPVYLLNNQEVFSTQGAPTKKELKKILK